MGRRWAITALSFVCLALAGQCVFAANSVSLAGQWKFELDAKNVGIRDGWFKKSLPDKVRLPGSLDENGKGTPNTRKPDLNHLSRLYEYTGAAWYQQDIIIPQSWLRERVLLFLERSHWETQVWLDGKWCEMHDSLCVPHIHELGSPSPGKHRLTIRVDNSMKYNVGTWSHCVTEETQTNWSGVIGRIELRATPLVWIKDVQVYPDVVAKTIRVEAVIRSLTHAPFRIVFRVTERGRTTPIATKIVKDHGFERGMTFEVTLPMGDKARPWDEFSPSLYDLSTKLTVVGKDSDERHTSFGMRDFHAEGKRLILNGRKIFLRGTLECCVFPRTGYPPTDVDSWLRIFKIAKSYGLNHMRFHSWCPPEAAFQAADRMGFLLHVELPQWVYDAGKDPRRDRFEQYEETRILDAYGSHPSFGMLCMGNELKGDPGFLQKLVVYGQKYDKRHLYTPSTAWSFGLQDDYNVASVRGIHGPGTDADFSSRDADSKVPMISHEVGQWCVFPNLAEMKKYTGVLRPRNFGLVREGLKAHGMLDQAAAFTRASGKLSAELYKEEIEVLLRTRGHGGFQLLDLHDFPGQGTALVGVLDAFWDSKGLITPAEWRRFCGPTVPLLRMSKRTWTTAEKLTARAEVAHFGPQDIKATPQWTVTDQAGRRIASGTLPSRKLTTGDLHELGSFSVPLSKVKSPAKLTVTVSLKGTTASNSWHIWVYPAKVEVAPPRGVLVTKSYAEAVSGLKSGKRVLFFATLGTMVESSPGSFYPVFWCPVWAGKEHRRPMGILCDPKHPALAGFPTDSYEDWQWYDVLEKSRNMVLDGTPAGFRPVVQIIDNFVMNRKLGNLVESQVGNGRLMACSMDLWTDLDKRPPARQMLSSILRYMVSSGFRPTQRLSFADLDTFLGQNKQTVLQSLGAKVAMVDSEDPNDPATNAIDGDPDSIWDTMWSNGAPPFPHEIQIDMRKQVALAGFRYLPRQEMENGWFTDYEFYVSEDGKGWGAPLAHGSFAGDASEKTVRFDKPVRGRFIRLVALKGYKGNPWAAIAELDVIPVPASG